MLNRLPGKNNFICLFIGIRGVKLHFPLISPLVDFSKSAFNSVTDLFTPETFEKRKVSSAKLLHIKVISSSRSLI